MAPTMGAVTTGFFSTQARATWAMGDATSFRYLRNHVDDGSVALTEEPSAHRIVVKALGVFTPRSGQSSLNQRPPWNASHTLVGEQPEHLPLLLALHRVVEVLHGHELRPTAELGDMLHLGELPGPHRRGADIASLPALTTSWSASRVSSIGVFGSNRWI